MSHSSPSAHRLIRNYFRNSAKRLFTLDVLLLTIGLVYPGTVVYGLRSMGGSLHRDYNRLPPANAFVYLFHRPVPADVRQLAAGGESWIGGSNVWVRFQCSPKTIQELKSGARSADPWKKGEAGIRDDASSLIRYDVPYRLGWNRVWKLRNAEYYVLGEGPGSTQFVIDRDTGMVYAFYVNI